MKASYHLTQTTIYQLKVKMASALVEFNDLS